jgi:hypothetical protein
MLCRSCSVRLHMLAKLRKATNSVVQCACQSAWNSSSPTGGDEVWCLRNFRKSVEKIQAALKFCKNNGCLKWRHIIPKIYHSVLRIMGKFSDKIVEKFNTHIACFVKFYRKSCRLWDNVEEYCRARRATDDNLIRCTRFARWIPNAPNTHSDYIIGIDFWRQRWSRDWCSVLSYTYIASIVIITTTTTTTTTNCN